MSIATPNKYLSSLLEHLSATFEAEVNYTPLEIELDPQQVSAEDTPTFLNFLTETRKRLFIFTFPAGKAGPNRLALDHLALIARRSILNKTAEIQLESTSNTPKINPLKHTLNTPSATIRAHIQIQKSFRVPNQNAANNNKPPEIIKPNIVPDLVLIPIDLPQLPILTQQLQVLNIKHIQQSAAEKIKAYPEAFSDGIIPGNLPKGFYVNYEQQALCYTQTPNKLPSGLAPLLEKTIAINWPTLEQAQALFPEATKELLNQQNLHIQKNALLKVLPNHKNDIRNFLQALAPAELQFIVPIIAKSFILGGEAHSILFIQLLNSCLNKKLSIEFLKHPEAENAFLSTQGIKNLQKLVMLPAEQREWWNTLVLAHLKNDKHSFNFNIFFEAYTQVFLPRITEKKLTLPTPCPIQHKGHFLITLNRVLDVLEQAQNPQEQCLTLTNLNWGPLGAHYAMTQPAQEQRFKHVTACMQLEQAEDASTDSALMAQHLDDEKRLNPWLFRYIGQHWKTGIRLSDVQQQLETIQKLSLWTPAQKNRLQFILACTYSHESTVNADDWKKNLKNCISLFDPLSSSDRSDLLEALTQCFQFKTLPSLEQIQALVQQCIELKTQFPAKHFKNELVTPLLSFLKHEGFELLNTLKERIQKTNKNKEQNAIIVSFTNFLQNNRFKLAPAIIQLLTKIHAPDDLEEPQIASLMQSFEGLKNKKNEPYYQLVLSTLNQINFSKSETLPTLTQIQALIKTLTELAEVPPAEHKTTEKQSLWLKDLIAAKDLLPGCVLGDGDISRLNDLLIDALVDAIKKRSAALKINVLKEELREDLQSGFVPQQLREKLDKELMPLFDEANKLIVLLQSPKPTFKKILKQLRLFEKAKPMLLEGIYKLGSLAGESKGEFLLSILLTREKKANDHQTKTVLTKLLQTLHDRIVTRINNFFNQEENRNAVKDLTPKMCLSWMKAFNETHTLTFFFKEELIEKKVIPALTKTLKQLHTEEAAFEEKILESARQISETDPSDKALENYKNTIEQITQYLNLLIDLKETNRAQFNALFKILNTDTLNRLNYAQKQILIKCLLKNPGTMEHYLNLTTTILKEQFNASPAAIERAVNGLISLFDDLPNLIFETQRMFFEMSMTHNLKNNNPFPLKTLSNLKASKLHEDIKGSLIKQIIYILSHLPVTENPKFIEGLIVQTQLFLEDNPLQAPLCGALLKRVAEEVNQNLDSYPHIIQQLNQLAPKPKATITNIIKGLANNKKDDTVNLATLLEITKGLARRDPEDLDRIWELFETTPCPIAQSLNSVLREHESEKLKEYCRNFDANPFAKTGEKRELSKHFATDRVQEALLSLTDLLHEVALPHTYQLQLAKQLTYIETLGYTDPLNPNDYNELKKLTNASRNDLRTEANRLREALGDKNIPPEKMEVIRLELLAYLREIYFRTTGLFPNTTQMLVLLLSLNSSPSNLLMGIKTGEGKSIITPILSVLQLAQGGTVNQFTANPTLLVRDYENNCEPFFKFFLNIKSALIQADSVPEDYQLNGINCSTIEDMSLFRLATREYKKENLIQNNLPMHCILDECDDALLDQILNSNLVAESTPDNHKETNQAQWIYPLAYQFVRLPSFRNLDVSQGKVWDQEDDVEHFRLYLNKQINERYKGDVNKQNYLMAATNTQLRQWIDASCKAAIYVEDTHFVVQAVKDPGTENIKKIVCVPLNNSTPKIGSIFPEGEQQALQARMIAERPDQASYFVIDADPPVLASQSARGLINFYQKTGGRLLGISGTPGDQLELKSLATDFGIQAIGIAPYAGDKRKKHPPTFTFSPDEHIKAIQQAIDKVKLPITLTTMVVNPKIRTITYDAQQKFVAQGNEAVEQWRLTQTQPILIIAEDFNHAHMTGLHLEQYRREGFDVQIVTGKESPDELDKIIKQAGQANTITVGTPMLARGIDIDVGKHPKGVLVIQIAPESERMTTQIAGRAARNGKRGEWLPIYQIKAPQKFWEKVLYYIFPWYRQNISEYAVETLKRKIKLQDTVDRLYTQAIDEIQQALMQQIQAWESFFLEPHPEDLQMQSELLQWRETLLSELNRLQENAITPQTLESSINKFKNVTCRLWEESKEEKWSAKAQKIVHMTYKQKLQFSYLKQLNLSQELNIQNPVVPKGQLFKEATQALIHQNLEATILDKAGAVLSYKPDAAEKEGLKIAQSKQLLPHLIGELCAVYPQAIKQLLPPKSQGPSLLPKIISALINRVVEEKNKVFLKLEERQQIIQTIVQFYQADLKNADHNAIKQVLKKIQPLIVDYNKILQESSLIEQFKMQGLMLSFSELCHQSGNDELETLKTSYGDEIMKKVAEYLLSEFSWIKEIPEPLHAFFERDIAKDAVRAIHSLAQQVKDNPQNKAKIQALYEGLQKQHLLLQDKYLFSIKHNSPRLVINKALAALDALHFAPHCDSVYRTVCQDSVLLDHHLCQFHACLEAVFSKPHAKNNTLKNHLKDSLLKISTKSSMNQIHLIHELYEAVERFKSYSAYKIYHSQLNTLSKQLTKSLAVLNTHLNQDVQESLLAEKKIQFANLFKVDAQTQVHIQNNTDGMKPHIQLGIAGTSSIEGFTGYKPIQLDKEKEHLKLKKADVEAKKAALSTLSDQKACEILTPSEQLEFKKLFTYHTLLSTPDQEIPTAIDGAPECIQAQLKTINALKAWDWENAPLDLEKLKGLLGKELDKAFIELVERQHRFFPKQQEPAAAKPPADKKQVILKKENSEQKLDALDQLKLGFENFTKFIKKPRPTPVRQQDKQERSAVITVLNTRKDIFIAELRAASMNALYQKSRELVQNLAIEPELNNAESTLTQIQNNEKKKSSYQIQRFFSIPDLLKFGAKHAQEESLIQKALEAAEPKEQKASDRSLAPLPLS